MPKLLPYTHHCFVCGKDNPHGMQLRFAADEGSGAVSAAFVPRDHHAGYPGIMHGGAVGAALDEAMFWGATFKTRRMHMSVELNVRYHAKTITGGAYRLVARLDQQRGAMCFTSAELVDGAGIVCASATGKFLPLPATEIARVLADVCEDPATIPLREFSGA